MGRHSSLPALYDAVLQINISKLKEWGYLNPGHRKRGTITWSRNGHVTDSIGITADTSTALPYIELAYTYNGQSRKYRVRLVWVPSNLGTGKVWYFLCPDTGKRCRILYYVAGWFLHREAFNGVYYDSQIQSQKLRNYVRVVGPLFKQDKLYEELRKPYFKSHYNGRPTKRYARIRKILNYRVSVEDYGKVSAGIF